MGLGASRDLHGAQSRAHRKDPTIMSTTTKNQKQLADLIAAAVAGDNAFSLEAAGRAALEAIGDDLDLIVYAMDPSTQEAFSIAPERLHYMVHRAARRAAGCAELLAMARAGRLSLADDEQADESKAVQS